MNGATIPPKPNAIRDVLSGKVEAEWREKQLAGFTKENVKPEDYETGRKLSARVAGEFKAESEKRGLKPKPIEASEHERAVIAACLVLPDAYAKVSNLLDADTFANPTNQTIYAAIVECATVHNAVDVLLVSQVLRQRKQLETIGGAYHLADITRYAFSSANIVPHAYWLMQCYQRRMQVLLAQKMLSLAGDDSKDAGESLDFFRKKLDVLEEKLKNKNAKSTVEVVEEAYNFITKPLSQQKDIRFTSTGYKELDGRMAGYGIGDGRLIIIAARPGVGKTAVMLNLAANMAADGIPVGYFSLEADAREMMEKLLSMKSGITSMQMMSKNLNSREAGDLRQAAQDITKWPIHFHDNNAFDIHRLRAVLRAWKKQHNLSVAFVDYLQLLDVDGNKSNRAEEVAKISRTLKRTAKELGIVIIAGSQLNRETYKRNNQRPILSDLRESGAIEQDADAVWMLYAPTVVEDEKEDLTAKGMSLSEIDPTTMEPLWWLIELNWAKNRMGMPGKKDYLKLWAQTGKIVPYYAATELTMKPPAYRNPAEPTTPDIRDFATGESHENEDMPF